MHGLLVGAFYSTLVGVYLPGECGFLQAISIRFHRPVHVGEKFDVTGIGPQLNTAVSVVEITGKIGNERGQTVSTATLIAGVLR